MSNPSARDSLRSFARYVKNHAERNGSELKGLTREFNRTFYCVVPMNPGGHWDSIAAPFLGAEKKGKLAALIKELDTDMRNRRVGANGVGIFYATPHKNGLWHQVLAHVPHVLPDAPPPAVKAVQPVRQAAPVLENTPTAHA